MVLAEYEEYDYSEEHTPTGGRPNVSMSEPVILPYKFEEWYPDFRANLEEISTTVCNLSLAAYRGDPEARQKLGPVRNYCFTHSNCIVASLRENVKASFAGTSILLGLAPTTLSVLGPSVGEMALLSIHRPFLTLLLSLGAPAIFPGRFLQWDDPLKANEPAVGAFIVRPFFGWKKWAVLIFQYAAAGGALANILQAAWRIGTRSVVYWSCSTSYWPLVWVLMSLIIHLCAILSLRTGIQKKQEFGSGVPSSAGAGDVEGGNKTFGTNQWGNQVHHAGPPGYNNVSVDDGSAGGNAVYTAKKPLLERIPLLWIFKSEFTLSSNSEWQVSDLYDIRLGPLPVVLQYAGAFLSVLYLVFGTILFSSLTFIGLGQAVELILRFVASATLCRLLVQFEVGGMIQVDERRVYRGVVQAPLPEKNE